MAIRNAIGETQQAELIEESIEVSVVFKPLHQADTDRAAYSTHLNVYCVRRENFCVHLADVFFGGTHISLADIADAG